MIIMEGWEGRWDRWQLPTPCRASDNNPRFGMQGRRGGQFLGSRVVTELRRIGGPRISCCRQRHTWKVSANECSVDDSIVTCTSGRKCSFGKCGARLAAQHADPRHRREDGRAVHRDRHPSAAVDITGKGGTGSSDSFGIDVARMPECVTPRSKTSRPCGAANYSNPSTTSGLPSMPRSKPPSRSKEGVIVVASSVLASAQGARRGSRGFDPAPCGLDRRRFRSNCAAGFDEPGIVARNDGDWRPPWRCAAKRVEDKYEVPTWRHAMLWGGPMNCRIG